jgi:hypothetical protein
MVRSRRVGAGGRHCRGGRMPAPSG